ncbi:MAG: ankyrin repeat domain-containing protein, partial [Acidobacteria bacterium]|nr:ankyrin repeat domain-containing protein [Acidobacteriota bacterium]
TDIVRLLLARGAAPNSAESDGTNALTITAEDRLAETIRIKLYEGLKQDLPNSDNMKATLAIGLDGHLEAIRLSEDNKINSAAMANLEKTTAFIRASKSGHIAIVKLAVRKDSPFDEKRKARFTDLMVASLNGYPEIVKLLADNGAKLNLKSSDGSSALILASQNGNAEVVKVLLEKGADPNLKDNKDKTALDYAGNQDIRNLLLP